MDISTDAHPQRTGDTMTEPTQAAKAGAMHILVALSREEARQCIADLIDAETALRAERDEAVAILCDALQARRGWFDRASAFVSKYPEPVDPVTECLRETYGGAAPEFVSAFKSSLAKRGLAIVPQESPR